MALTALEIKGILLRNHQHKASIEYILQMARSHIEKVTGYDFMNDFSGSGTEIYTYGNYLCSSYDYSSEAVSELKEKIADHLDCLMQNKWCRYVLSELEIGVN